MSQHDAPPALRSTWALSAVAAVDDVRAGRQSSVALVEEARGRMETDDPSVGAIAELRADAALEEAAAVDRGEPAGPLAGVPITIKAAIPSRAGARRGALRMPASTGLSGMQRGGSSAGCGAIVVATTTPIRCSPTSPAPRTRCMAGRATPGRPGTGLVAPRVGRQPQLPPGSSFSAAGRTMADHPIRSRGKRTPAGTSTVGFPPRGCGRPGLSAHPTSNSRARPLRDRWGPRSRRSRPSGSSG